MIELIKAIVGTKVWDIQYAAKEMLDDAEESARRRNREKICHERPQKGEEPLTCQQS